MKKIKLKLKEKEKKKRYLRETIYLSIYRRYFSLIKKKCIRHPHLYTNLHHHHHHHHHPHHEQY